MSRAAPDIPKPNRCRVCGRFVQHAKAQCVCGSADIALNYHAIRDIKLPDGSKVRINDWKHEAHYHVLDFGQSDGASPVSTSEGDE